MLFPEVRTGYFLCIFTANVHRFELKQVTCQPEFMKLQEPPNPLFLVVSRCIPPGNTWEYRRGVVFVRALSHSASRFASPPLASYGSIKQVGCAGFAPQVATHGRPIRFFVVPALSRGCSASRSAIVPDATLARQSRLLIRPPRHTAADAGT